MNLDDKLKEILKNALTNYLVVGSLLPNVVDNSIAEIKRSFSDAGYGIIYINGEPITELMFNDGTHLMSGQEWFDKFTKEAKVLGANGYHSPAYIAAAKRASGLEQA